MTTPKVSLYSLSDLKNTLDDHLPIYLTSPNLLPTSGPSLPKPLRFTQSHTYTYIRLGLGYSAVAIAAYLFYLDWYLKIPFSTHKRIAAPAVVAYFLLNGALQAWIWFGERGIVFDGERKAGKESGMATRLTVHSRPPHRKYDPVYRLTVAVGEGEKAGFMGNGEEVEVEAPFMRFFAQDGGFVAREFEGWLRECIPVLGAPGEGKTGTSTPEAIPAVTASPSAMLKELGSVEEEDVVLVDSSLLEGANASASGIGGTPSGGKRRPKKKA